MNLHPDEADDTNVDTDATRNAPVPVGRLRIERERRAATERDQETQVVRRLVWAGLRGLASVTVAEIAADLAWPGGPIGVGAVLRRLREQGRAVEVTAGRWSAATLRPDRIPSTTPQEAPVKLAATLTQDAPMSATARIADYLADHPGSRPKEIAAALSMPPGTVSSKLATGGFHRVGDGTWCLLRNQEPVKRESRPALPLPEILEAGKAQTIKMPAGPAPAPPQPAPEAAPAPAPEAAPTKPPPEVASAPPAAHGIGSGFAAIQALRNYRDELRAEVGELQDEIGDHKARIRACRREVEALELAALRIDQAIRLASGAA